MSSTKILQKNCIFTTQSINIFRMRINSFIIFIALIIAENVKSQNIILDCLYYGDEASYYITDFACFKAKLIFQHTNEGWKLTLKDNPSEKEKDVLTPLGLDSKKELSILFPKQGTKIEVSKNNLVLSNENNQTISMSVFVEDMEGLFNDSIICGTLYLNEGLEYELSYITPSYKYSNIFDEFNKLSEQISKPYKHKCINCDTSIMGLINNPLGLSGMDSWQTTFSEFITTAERFYGKYEKKSF